MLNFGFLSAAQPRVVSAIVGLLLLANVACGEERRQTFDADPQWDAFHNRSSKPQPIRQNFGYSPTNHAGGRMGEMGGLVNPAAETAYYARVIDETDLNRPLRASGRVAATSPGFHALVGFFNADTVNEWRTPNSVALRFNGRGDYFYAYLEYCTQRWRAGGDRPQPFGRLPDPSSSRMELVELPLRDANGKTASYSWSLEYDPQANNGDGALFGQIGDVKAICHLDPGHKADGARFNRFGMLPVLKQWDDAGELWLDDVEVNGMRETFDSDPQWDERDNRREYVSTNVRPRFDFGFTTSQHAGGAQAGELGGLVFRGDCRYLERMAYYGDRVGSLNMAQPLRAAGRIALRRGVSDSSTLFGFFHSKKSVAQTDSQDCGWPMNFVGVAIEGPSSHGFLIYPAYRADEGRHGCALGDDRPSIPPDGKTHDFAFRYQPRSADQPAQLIAELDGKQVAIEVQLGDDPAATEFDRLGLVTTWIDGNGQHVFFDDLTYTAR